MATRSLLYSATAVRRVLGLHPSTPIEMEEFLRVIWVWVKGKKPTFISKADLKEHFVKFRKDEAKQLKVSFWETDPNRYTVKNPKNQSQHQVNCLSDRVECDCQDYHQQVQVFGHGCCKHGYAVLQHLGINSLATYLKIQQRRELARQQKLARQDQEGDRQLELIAS